MTGNTIKKTRHVIDASSIPDLQNIVDQLGPHQPSVLQLQLKAYEKLPVSP